jgi:prepilin-type N-terminal cleavage/methylation domain-containing protein
MKIKTQNTTRESGFTLLELLLVIGVAALLLIGAIATYRLVSDGNKTTDSIRTLLTIRQETNTMAQQQGGTYTGVVYDTATSNTASPIVASGVLHDKQKNPFNGNIVVAAVPDAGGTADANLTVKFDNVSQSGCSKLAQAINTPNEIVSVTINGTAYTTFPVTAAQAGTSCSSTNLGVITWQFP